MSSSALLRRVLSRRGLIALGLSFVAVLVVALLGRGGGPTEVAAVPTLASASPVSVAPTPGVTTAAPTQAPVPPAAPVAAPVAVPAVVPASGDVLDGPPPGPQVDPVPPRTAPASERWAFVVGVTDYRAPTSDTIGGANDAVFVRDSLLRAGWLPDHVRVLTDGAATGAAVREGMTWLAAHDTPGSFAMFHFSGHVKQLGAGTEGLWTVDRDFVRDTQVSAALGGVQGRLWVDIAGCEAGSFLPGLPSERVLFTGSSAANEKSYEFPAWRRSVWTGLVFDQGLAQGKADADADGRVTIGEALRYATYHAQKITRDQRPYGRQTPLTAGDPVLGWTLDAPPA